MYILGASAVETEKNAIMVVGCNVAKHFHLALLRANLARTTVLFSIRVNVFPLWWVSTLAEVYAI